MPEVESSGSVSTTVAPATFSYFAVSGCGPMPITVPASARGSLDGFACPAESGLVVLDVSGFGFAVSGLVVASIGLPGSPERRPLS